MARLIHTYQAHVDFLHCFLSTTDTTVAQCAIGPNNAIEGTFVDCPNLTSLNGTCNGTCAADYEGSLSAVRTGNNVWTVDNKCTYKCPGWFFSIGCVGGVLSGGKAATTVRYIDPAATSLVWLPGPPLNVDRTGFGGSGPGLHSGMANAWDKYIYVYGGGDASTYAVDFMVRLDVTNFTAGWSRVVRGGDHLTSPPPHRYNGVTAALEGVFYFVGGFNTANGAFTFITTTSSYDPATNIWTSSVPGAALPLPVDNQIGYRGCMVSLGGWLYYMRYQYLLKWKPGQLSWTAITTIPPWQNAGAPSCVAAFGKVVQMVDDVTNTYDPITGTFSTLPGSGARNHHFPVAQNVPSPCSKGRSMSCFPRVIDQPVQFDCAWQGHLLGQVIN